MTFINNIFVQKLYDADKIVTDFVLGSLLAYNDKIW